ncbi:hypothetical protein GCM10010193_70540 [Kitasatospora atroaurantiaca]|uniref:Uncharacterized protein n=1 Tax=Kitasatospora atroaurantiaca TaxID=285545 RepID=A0A561ENK2_9ACTN|nr:hypothetical protein [Kitasatospora atroaurantiaca]TWE17139.1 hypothetical protein FB465_2144 [Kitasatospora atroaurantiaca]
MTTLLRATTELVAQAWLRGVLGDIVATTLPRDNASWMASGFVTVATVGGSANPYVPLRSPVVSVDCWAVHPGSNRPPWNKATSLAERVQAACWDHAATPRLLTLPANYPQARVLSAYSTYEARRVPDDAASYARINLGLSVNWVEVAS